jgi:catechol 2,3-dioxygenase-like lactoylglutathione lyase family enzyme
VIALVPPGPGYPTSVPTGIIFNTDDIDVTHAELRALGVDVDDSVARVGGAVEIRIGAVETSDPVPPMFYFRDPDGNTFLIVQPG